MLWLVVHLAPTETTEKSSDALNVPRTVALMPSGCDRGPEAHTVWDRPTTRLLDSRYSFPVDVNTTMNISHFRMIELTLRSSRA